MEDRKAKLISIDGIHLVNMSSENLERIPSAFFYGGVAATLLARDYKGLNNRDANGVIEIWKITKK